MTERTHSSLSLSSSLPSSSVQAGTDGWPGRNQRTEQRPLLAMLEGRKKTCAAVVAGTAGGEKGYAGKDRIRGRCTSRSSGRGRAGWRLHAEELWDGEAEQDLMEELRWGEQQRSQGLKGPNG